MELIDEPVAGFDEGLVVVVLDEANDVATFATDETLEDVFLLVDMHGGMGVVMVPALGTLGDWAHTIEGDAEFGTDIEDG